MRVLIAVVILVMGMIWMGWVQLSTPSGEPTVHIDAIKVRHDTSVAVKTTKDALNKATAKIDRILQSSR